MIDPDKALILANLMLNCAKSGSNLPVLLVKKGKNSKPDKVVKVEIYCPNQLLDYLTANEYWSSNSKVNYKTFQFMNATLCYHNKKKVPSWCTNDSRNEYLTTYHLVVGCKTSKRARGVKKEDWFNVSQIEIPETAKILYGRGNAQL